MVRHRGGLRLVLLPLSVVPILVIHLSFIMPLQKFPVASLLLRKQLTLAVGM